MKLYSKSGIIYTLAIIGASALIYACANQKNLHSKKLETVQRFEVNKYLGLWYEIARIDFKHEKDLKNVTANYSLKENGKIKVVNRGFNYVKNNWQEAEGKATFRGAEDRGALKVSFFGPFYSEYNVVMMEPEYENVLVFGKNTDYLWILSRKKSIPPTVKEKFIQYAAQYGYDLSRIVWTIQDENY